jgi:hypothetical protein
MRKVISVFALVLAFIAGMALSAQIRDWRDPDEVHSRVVQSIHDMERAHAANHYDMLGHGIKAENHLRAAERELGLAIDAAKASAK